MVENISVLPHVESLDAAEALSSIQLLKPDGNETLVQDPDDIIFDADTKTKVHPQTSPDDSLTGVPIGGQEYILHNVKGFLFEVPCRYISPIPVGRGACGIVCSFVDSRQNKTVAIRKIQNAFQMETRAKQVLREIVIQRNMDHDSVLSITDVIVPRDPRRFQDVYIVYEYMPSDLKNVIQMNPISMGMDGRHFKLILFNLLRGLRYIHAANVVHRGLKPSNILIDQSCKVKISGFRNGRTLHDDGQLTNYVVHRYYRAPELLLGLEDYNGAVDVWSVGCIFLELVTGNVALKGNTILDQLRKIFQLVGSPTEDDLHWLKSDTSKNYIKGMQNEVRQDFRRDLLPETLYPGAADLVEKIFTFDYEKRITVDEALRHPYFAQYSHHDEGPVKSVPYDVSFSQADYTIPCLRQIVYEEAKKFS